MIPAAATMAAANRAGKGEGFFIATAWTTPASDRIEPREDISASRAGALFWATDRSIVASSYY